MNAPLRTASAQEPASSGRASHYNFLYDFFKVKVPLTNDFLTGKVPTGLKASKMTHCNVGVILPGTVFFFYCGFRFWNKDFILNSVAQYQKNFIVVYFYSTIFV